MDHIVFIIFRRMRRPLITLTVIYAISILGLVLIPGQDATGKPWHMDFFHAIYFTSFMATTIGFGEIPFEFTDAQRLWVTFSMYAGVIGWLYAIGTILTLVQDKTFQQSIAENRLAKRIRQIREPFYLICGYGETGSALVRGLTDVGQHVVVIEAEEQRSNLVKIDNLRDYVPILHGDARRPMHLKHAGLEHPLCRAVVAVTDNNQANLKIAITSKLLHPDIKVICRADSHEIEDNMASFGTDYIIDPYDSFATTLATAFQVPGLFLLQSWLYSGNKNHQLDEPVYPPIHSHWIICGFGRFGKAVYERLKQEKIEVIVIEAKPEITGEPNEGIVLGPGTEAKTLLEANIENACGLIAGTDNDVNNLSIVVTAKKLNPDLFTIVRQNYSDNIDIINAVNADIVMHPSKIIADKIRVLLGTPMLHEFMSLAFYQNNDWACELVSRISGLVSNHVPRIEEVIINQLHAEAVINILDTGGHVLLGDLLRDPWNRKRHMNCIVLMLKTRNNKILLPTDDVEIKAEDRLLVCTGRTGLTRFYWNLQHENILSYARTGKVSRYGWLWNKLIRNP